MGEEQKAVSVQLEGLGKEKGAMRMGRGPHDHGQGSGGLARHDFHSDGPPPRLNCIPQLAIPFSLTLLYIIFPKKYVITSYLKKCLSFI